MQESLLDVMLNMVRTAKAKDEGRDPKAHQPAPIPEQPAIIKPVGVQFEYQVIVYNPVVIEMRCIVSRALRRSRRPPRTTATIRSASRRAIRQLATSKSTLSSRTTDSRSSRWPKARAERLPPALHPRALPIRTRTPAASRPRPALPRRARPPSLLLPLRIASCPSRPKQRRTVSPLRSRRRAGIRSAVCGVTLTSYY